MMTMMMVVMVMMMMDDDDDDDDEDDGEDDDDDDDDDGDDDDDDDDGGDDGDGGGGGGGGRGGEGGGVGGRGGGSPPFAWKITWCPWAAPGILAKARRLQLADASFRDNFRGHLHVLTVLAATLSSSLYFVRGVDRLVLWYYWCIFAMYGIGRRNCWFMLVEEK